MLSFEVVRTECAYEWQANRPLRCAIRASGYARDAARWRRRRRRRDADVGRWHGAYAGVRVACARRRSARQRCGAYGSAKHAKTMLRCEKMREKQRRCAYDARALSTYVRLAFTPSPPTPSCPLNHAEFMRQRCRAVRMLRLSGHALNMHAANRGNADGAKDGDVRRGEAGEASEREVPFEVAPTTHMLSPRRPMNTNVHDPIRRSSPFTAILR